MLTGSVSISLRGVMDMFRTCLLRGLDEDFVGGGIRKVCVVLRNTWKAKRSNLSCALADNSTFSKVDDFGGRYFDWIVE